MLLPIGLGSAIFRVQTGRARCSWSEMWCCGAESGRWAYGKGVGAISGPRPLYASPLSQILLLGIVLAYLVCAGGYFWYLSLPFTSIPANNAIYQSCSAVVFLLSWLFLGERATMQKFAAVGVSIGGVVLIAAGGTTSQATDSHPNAFGYAMVVVSVVLYAIYEVVYSRYGEPSHACVGAPGVHGHADNEDDDEDTASAAEFADLEDAAAAAAATDDLTGSSGKSGGMSTAIGTSASVPSGARMEDGDVLSPHMRDALDRLGAWAHPPTDLWSQAELSALMMGLVGVFTALLVWPFIPILDVTGIETLVWPLPEGKWGMLALNAVLDTAYNGLLLVGILVSSPLIISVGVMLVVPASMVADGIINDTRFEPLAYVGVACILLGFALLKMPSSILARCFPCCCTADAAKPQKSIQEALLADMEA